MPTRSMALFVIGLSLAVAALADPLDQWHWRNPLPEGNSLQDVVFGAGLFVAVGGWGTVLTSADGRNWSAVRTGETMMLEAITFGNGLFVAAGWKRVLTSADGVNWSSYATDVSIGALAYGNGIYVAVGEGRIWTSPDGIAWTAGASELGGNPTGVTYAHGSFVVTDASKVLLSTDGVTWSQNEYESPGTLFAAAVGRDSFVAVGGISQARYDSRSLILASTDGRAWRPQEPNGYGYLFDIVYGNDLFVAVGGHSYPGGAQGTVLTSPDGTHWTSRDTEIGAFFRGVAYGSGTFVAVGFASIITSSDGVHWTKRSQGSRASRFGIAYGDGTFVSVGDPGPYTPEPTSGILTSTDAIDWSPQYYADSFETLLGVAHGDGIFVAVGYGGTIRTSTDAITWNKRSTGTGAALEDITWGNGLFVAVGSIYDDAAGGEQTFVMTSPDGLDWTSRIPGIDGALVGISYGNGVFVAVGRGPYQATGSPYMSRILTSPDGRSWTAQSSQDGQLNDVVYGDGRFVAVGGFSNRVLEWVEDVQTSTDGVHWIRWTNDSSHIGTLNSVAFGKGNFVAVGERVMTSVDATHWFERNVQTFGRFSDIVFGGGTFVVGGDWGNIMQSDPLTETAPSIIRGSESRREAAGTTTTFAVTAAGSSPIRYQWSGPHGVIERATNAVLTLRDVQSADAGDYQVVASNAYGIASSLPARLQIGPTPGTSARLDVRANFYPELILSGAVGNYRIEVAEEVGPNAAWRSVRTLSLSSGPYLWTDTTDPVRLTRFYRAVLQP